MNFDLNLVLKKNNLGLGKRKEAVAQVSLVRGSGKIIINNIVGKKYLQYNDTYLNHIYEPLKKVKQEKYYDIIVSVKGGGLTGQAESIQLGVARLLCKIEKKYRPILKQFGYLTRDARIKERKKYGLRKARKAPQYSKR